MIRLNELQILKAQSCKRPFDVGYESGLSRHEIFACPYGHTTRQDLRKRHEWLNGYLTALANSNCIIELV